MGTISTRNEKTTIHDTDIFPMVDIEAETDETKKITWANIKKYAILQALLTTRGDIPFRGASVAERLAKGTEKQALVQGANDPEWGWRLLTPNGADWKNRTYSGMELLTTNTAYTIGSGKDFETLGACASALNGLIMSGANIIVQLEENIEISSEVEFAGILGMGGILILELNSYDITVNMNGTALTFDGLSSVYIKDSVGGSEIKAKSGGDCSTSTRFLQFKNGCIGSIYDIQLDLNGETIRNFVYVLNAANVCFADDVSFVDDAGGGTVNENALKVALGAFVFSDTVLGIGADDMIIDRGIVVDSGGDIHTEGGEEVIP